MSLPDLQAQIAALVQASYDSGMADGKAAAAAPLLAIEAEMGSDLSKVQAEIQDLMNPPAPPAPPSA